MEQLTRFEQVEKDATTNGALARAHEALRDAKRIPFWIDQFGRDQATEELTHHATTDLLVVGGGYCGLWTALRAKQRYPKLEVTLIEAKEIAWAASGRNGGFCEPSLTHGRANAAIHIPESERKYVEELGETNLEELLQTLEELQIECDIQPHGVIKLATEPHQAEIIHNLASTDDTITQLEGQELYKQVATQAAPIGAWAQAEGVLLNPVKLANGLREACESLGVTIYEHTPATKLHPVTDGVAVSTPKATILAQRVALATNGFPSLLKRTRLHTVPVYDYAIVTEPLTKEQRASLNWELEQGVTDMNSKFHYMRLLTDNQGKQRILLGGYDAKYHPGRKIKPQYETSEETFTRLAIHLEEFFPQLRGIKISHAWGGMIDTCTRFFPFFTQSHANKVAAAAGFTGLGVAATRFAADVLLDLLYNEKTQRVGTTLVKKMPLPFPPEPFLWPSIAFTTHQMVRSDHRGGKKGPWLWLLEKLKLGFDS